jgi:hypothetical protein
MRPYLKKNPSQNKAGGVAQDVDPRFKPQYCKEKKKEKCRGNFDQSTLYVCGEMSQ